MTYHMIFSFLACAKGTPKSSCNDIGGFKNNFTKNGYITYIIGKSLEGVVINQSMDQKGS